MSGVNVSVIVKDAGSDKQSMEQNKESIIAIRADGNAVLGMGHIMRCMSIAVALEKRGRSCVFFTAEEEAGCLIREKGFTCRVLHTDYRNMEGELPELQQALEGYIPALWLVDSYQITQDYLNALRTIAPTVYLDDTGEKVYEADGLINYNIYGDELDYRQKCPENMRLFLGAGYAPVKAEFSETPYRVRDSVKNVLITMGGSDALNITGQVSRELLRRLPAEVKLTLICGRFNTHLQELLQLQETESRVSVLVDVADMWNQLAQADVAISAAGSTMYELSAMGVPSVCCYYVENQRRIAEGFAAKVRLLNGGDFSQNPEAVMEKLIGAVCELVNKKKDREDLSRRMKQVSDGLGAMRIAEALLERSR